MYGFEWNGVAAGSIGVAIGLVAVIAFSRRRTRRRDAQATVEVENEAKKRIDVVAIDAPTTAPKRETRC
jgi:predicted nuclease with RNAse H fold